MVRRVAVVAAVVGVLGGAVSVPASATTPSITQFSSCESLLVEYPNGVAKSKKAANEAVRNGQARPKVSKSLYKKNGARLDRDKDGVMCEQSR